jgi:hypothetical protein
MSDVIKIAKERRARLAAEVTKLDDFIRMAEALVEWNSSKAGKAADGDDERPIGANGPSGSRVGMPGAVSEAKS